LQDTRKYTIEQAIIPLDLTNVNGDAMHFSPTIVSDEKASEAEEDSVLPLSTRRPPEGLQSAESILQRIYTEAAN